MLNITLLLTDPAGTWHQVGDDWQPLDDGGPMITGVPAPVNLDGETLAAAIQPDIEGIVALTKDMPDAVIECVVPVRGEPVTLCTFRVTDRRVTAQVVR